MRSYSETLNYIFNLRGGEIDLRLHRVTEALALFGHPERFYRAFHIAGTNGKGSTAAMLHRILSEEGYRTALYTSPHLVSFTERIRVGDEEISREEVVKLADFIRRGSEAKSIGLTFFEFVTVMALVYFSRREVDVAVVEVGLGGRFDATNVVIPQVSAITSIAKDHEAYLGSDLLSIAREKGGIIKAGVPVVCGPLPPEAAAVIERVARATGAPLVRAPDTVSVARRRDGRVDFRSSDYVLDGVQLALPGRHQADNAAVVVALLAELERLGVRVGADAARAGLATVSWPGRLEHVTSGDTRILLDAAHNPAGAAALREYLLEIGWTHAVLVFGAMRDKEVGAMLAALAPCCDRVICTTAASPRAMAAEDIARVAAGVARWAVDAEGDPASALARARRAGSRVVVAGSIFLIGPLRDILR